MRERRVRVRPRGREHPSEPKGPSKQSRAAPCTTAQPEPISFGSGKSAPLRSSAFCAGTMLIFAPPTSFDDWGEYFSDWTRSSQTVAGIMVFVSLAGAHADAMSRTNNAAERTAWFWTAPFASSNVAHLVQCATIGAAPCFLQCSLCTSGSLSSPPGFPFLKVRHASPTASNRNPRRTKAY